MELLERLGLYARAPDSRPMAEIRAEIDEELAFHLAECARSLAADGFDESEAQAEARRRFGDLARIRRACARTQLGERIMVQRIQLVLTSVLIAAVGALLWSNHAARADNRAERETTAALASELARIGEQLEAGLARSSSDAATADAAALADLQEQRRRELQAHLQRSTETTSEAGDYSAADGRKTSFTSAAKSWQDEFQLNEASWRHGFSVAERMASLPGAQGVEFLAAIWKKISREHQEQVLKAFMREGGHPHGLELLAVADRNGGSGQARAREYLPHYTWRYLNDVDGWIAQQSTRPVRDVLEASITSWASELALLCQDVEKPKDTHLQQLFQCVNELRLDIATGAGVDVAAILEQTGVCAIQPERFAHLNGAPRRKVELVLSWCKR